MTLGRRVDAVAVIGRALRMAAGGTGHRRVAAGVDRPASTVRHWLRRFAAAALRVAALPLNTLEFANGGTPKTVTVT